jgi:formate hydrogenlyase subunit 5
VTAVLTRTIPVDMLVADAAELRQRGFKLAMITVSDSEAPELRYIFCGPRGMGWQQLVVRTSHGERRIPSLTPSNVAADWLEREIEDLFAIDFSGHPRLGDFVLHDRLWAEGVGPMRPGARLGEARVDREWQPRRVLREEGAFVLPVGPIYSGESESALFLLETVGEDVVRAVPRLFYKYRGIEKLAERRKVQDTLLLVERANGTSAFAHAWAYAMAAESILDLHVPGRAQHLRTLLAEIERVRRHVAVLRAIVDSTAMLVPTAQLFELEEWLLRTCCELTGHRYLFGLACIGGLQRDLSDTAITAAVGEIAAIANNALSAIEQLGRTSSFLDRIERVGLLTGKQAREFGAVGPFARASNVAFDVRHEQPYGVYDRFDLEIPTETEGDGYARLRVLARELRASLDLLSRLVTDIPGGSLLASWEPRSGESLGCVEAPGGMSVLSLSLDENGNCVRLRFTPPSFRNWQCFRLVAEDFAFQDFPIILATCGLSVAESDR